MMFAVGFLNLIKVGYSGVLPSVLCEQFPVETRAVGGCVRGCTPDSKRLIPTSIGADHHHGRGAPGVRSWEAPRW